MMAIYDKNNRQIQIGDVLKVFHFTGKYGKKNYMYKHVIDYRVDTPPKNHYVVSHLDLSSSPFYIKNDENVLEDIEIVQSIKEA